MIEILSRYTSAVLYRGADAHGVKNACEAAVNSNADLRGANLYGANLRNADLRGANLYGADLGGADLYGADLRGANLRGADLDGANLRGANLGDANLGGADLGDANLGGADLGDDKLTMLIARVARSDGYEFFALGVKSGGYKIRAGCRWMTPTEYAAHIKAEYPNTDKATETKDILRFFALRFKRLEGYIK